jgi:hypothetical protein
MRTLPGTALWLVFAASAAGLAAAGLLTGSGTVGGLPVGAVGAGAGVAATTAAAGVAALAGWPDATGTAVDPRAPAARAGDADRDGGGDRR